MQDVAIELVIFFSLGLAMLGLGFIYLLLLIVLHNILYRKFDSILFIRLYFTQAELGLYARWPLGFLKSMIYMTLILFPGHARKKRFKELSHPITVSLPLKIACSICMLLLFLALFTGISAFVYAGGLYVNNEFLK